MIWNYEFRFDLPKHYTSRYEELYRWCELHAIDEFTTIKVMGKVVVSFKSYTDYYYFEQYINPVEVFEDVPY